jgi:hypothetical protein
MPGITREELERMYEGCQMTVDEVMAALRDSARRTLRDLGFVVDYASHEGTDRERATEVFKVDGIINPTQVRNGLIRSQRIFRTHVGGQPPAKVNMDLMAEHNIDSYLTLEHIIYGKR